METMSESALAVPAVVTVTSGEATRVRGAKRVKVRGLTIDDRSTRDMDDAIWVHDGPGGATVLTITIADVARAIPIDSDDDKAALDRVVTRYYASGNSPMLPRDLADDQLSLRPKVPRKSMSVEVTLHADGTRTSRIFRSRLVSEEKVSYDAVPRILALATGQGAVRDTVQRLAKVAIALLDARRKSGALALYDLNEGWITTEEGALKFLERREDTIGQIIVQELMILANTTVAEYAIEHDIPILYRNHTARAAAPPREELFAQLETAIHTPIANLDALRKRVHMLLDRARYEGFVNGHYGLALPAYTHWTSPIRRYADLVNQRQFRAHLRGEPLPYTHVQIDALGVHINDRLQAIRDGQSQRFADTANGEAAKRSTDERLLDGLDFKAFERVMKVSARSGDDIAEPPFRSCLRRLEEQRLSMTAMVTVLFEAKAGERWTELREAIVEALRKKPEDAISALNLAASNNLHPMPLLVFEQQGATHMPLFIGKATSADGATTWTEDGATGRQAKQRAALRYVQEAVGAAYKAFPPVPARVAAETAAAAPPPPVAAPPKAPEPVVERNPISLLMERAQAALAAPPTFTFEATGPSHAPVVRCTCIGLGIKHVASGASKQHAKTAVAKLMNEALDRRDAAVARAKEGTSL